jgi:hypothetical protein
VTRPFKVRVTVALSVERAGAAFESCAYGRFGAAPNHAVDSDFATYGAATAVGAI